MPSTDGQIRFDRFQIDLRSRELTCGDRRVGLQDKTHLLLLALLERPGDVVSRTALYDALWPSDRFVDRPTGLNTAVFKLRAALNQAAGEPCDLLQTLPRTGYRLRVGASRPIAASAPELDRPFRAAGAGTAGRWGLAVSIGLLLVASLTLAPGGRSAPQPMPADEVLRGHYVEARSLLSAGRDLDRARQLLGEVVGAAPDFAPAHAYLAEVDGMLAMRGGREREVEAARRSARTALDIDPRSAVANRALAMIELLFDWNLESARPRFERAIALDPDDAVSYLTRAFYLSIIGDHDAALADVRRAVDLEPDSMPVRSDAGYFLLRAGRAREAVVECRRALRLDPDHQFAQSCLLAALELSGDPEAARPHALRLVGRSGNNEAARVEIETATSPRRAYSEWMLGRLMRLPERPAVSIATHFLVLGDEGRALEWLEIAARARDRDLLLVPQSATFGSLRGDTRFDSLLRQAGLGSLLDAPRV